MLNPCRCRCRLGFRVGCRAFPFPSPFPLALATPATSILQGIYATSILRSSATTLLCPLSAYRQRRYGLWVPICLGMPWYALSASGPGSRRARDGLALGVRCVLIKHQGFKGGVPRSTERTIRRQIRRLFSSKVLLSSHLVHPKLETGITLLPNFLMEFPKWTRPQRTDLFQAFNVRASPWPFAQHVCP